MHTSITPPAPDPPSFEKVWQMFQETKQMFQETERFLKEKSLETDKKFQETERFLKENSLETDKKFQETEKFIDKNSRDIRNLFQGVDDINNSWKRFTEGFMMGSGLEVFKKWGIDVKYVHQNITIPGECEYDGVFVNSTEAIVMEFEVYYNKCKEIDWVVEKLGSFRKRFPLFSRLKIYGAVGSFKYGNGIYEYARKKGLFVVKGGDDSEASILNPQNFKPKAF